MSFDDAPETAFVCPALSAVRQPIDAMAEDPVTALLEPERLAAGTAPAPVELVERDSVGPPVSW